MPPLTEQAQAFVRDALRPGDTAIDATAGNGCDTRFLADQVGPSGRVIALDIQPEALQRTARLLESEALSSRVTLLLRDHAELQHAVPVELHGRIAAVMFNLGYLPKGDKSVVTRSEATLAALNSAVALLRPEGVVTILAYTGHPQGREEAEQVVAWLAGLPSSDYVVTEVPTPPGKLSPPRLFLLRKPLRLR